MTGPVEAMLPLGARVRLLFVVALLLGASAVIVGGDVAGFMSGIDEERDESGGATTTLVEGGCSCHNQQYTGNVRAVLEGVPSFYAFGDKLEQGPFELTVRIIGGPPPSPTGAQGGFNLQVTEGELAVPEGKDDVQILNGEASHTLKGNKQRSWNVTWKPPAEAGPDAAFTLTVNSVDGNGAPAPPDQWGRAVLVSMGAQRLGAAGPAAGEKPEGVKEIRALGVSFLAYWVGVISFIVLFVVLAATFFLLRYGESRHWTDQRDRPAKEKGEAPKATGTWIVLGIVLVVFVVAVVQVMRVV